MKKLLPEKKKSSQDIPPKPKPDRSFKSFLHLVKSFMRKLSKDKLDVYSAQTAFYLMMATIPMLMLIMMTMKFLPLTEEMVLDALSEILNDSLMSSVRLIVGNLYHGSVTIVSIATFTMLWVSSKAVIGLGNGLNSIYGIRENRNFAVLRLWAMGYTILLVFTFILCFGVLAFGLRIRTYLAGLLPFFNIHNRGVRITLTIIGLILMTLVFNMLYVFLPNRKIKFTSQMYGAVFTTVSWTIYTFIYSLYLTVAKNVSIVYGGLVTLMVTMLWLYFGLLLFFFGAEINAWKENPDNFPF